MSYNGWTDRATWATNMYIYELGFSDMIAEEVQRLRTENAENEDIAKDTADFVRGLFEDLLDQYLPANGCGLMLRDLLPPVDWLEIAEHYVDDNE